jgi:gamma-glutamylcyclotransferase (GGCT)/AIG2-like uncharacterized protein YtfP
MTPYLFVYGTLMVGIESKTTGFLHNNSKWLGSAYMPGIMYDLGRYPGAICMPGHNKRVYGQLFLLEEPEFMLYHLDEYEGVSHLHQKEDEYVREIIKVTHEDEQKVYEAWSYLLQYPSADLKVIQTGRYLDYVNQQQSHLSFIREV